MRNKANIADRFGAEVINNGGFLMTRVEAYKLFTMQGWSHADADKFAFGYSRAMPGAVAAWTAEEAFAVTGKMAA